MSLIDPTEFVPPAFQPDVPADRTANGVEITVGLRVFTNDWCWGTVTAAPKEWDEAGWWEVTLDGHARPKTYNGDRMTTRAPR